MRSAGYRRSVIKVKVPVKCKNVYLQLQIATAVHPASAVRASTFTALVS
jgi:hypothetical protein